MVTKCQMEPAASVRLQSRRMKTIIQDIYSGRLNEPEAKERIAIMGNTVVALKEWAVAVQALTLGKQIVVMRKGGIREETRDFQVESDSFYLYPTYEHQKAELVKPEFVSLLADTRKDWNPGDTETVIRAYARLEEDLLVDSQEQLDKLRDCHIWTDRFAEERLRWKRTKPLHVMLLRVYELERPVRVPILSEYVGCKSWIGLPGELEAVPRKPVLGDEAFRAEADRVRSFLGIC